MKLPLFHKFQKIASLYAILILPECVGSVDCENVVWDKFSTGLLLQCKGKERLPTLVFDVVASHSKK